MRRIFAIGPVIAILIFSCQTNVSRDPDSARVHFDVTKTLALRSAVDHGIFFNLPDSLTEDAPVSEINSECRKIGPPSWIGALTEYLNDFSRKTDLYSKFHVIEIRRGDAPQALMHEDLDGARTLSLTYTKTETRSKAESLTDIPCATSNMGLVGQPLRQTNFKYPSFAQIEKALDPVGDRKDIPRLTVDRAFLQFIADRLTVLRFSSELSFEMNSKGESLLNSFTKTMANQMKGTSLKEFDFWLNEMQEKGFATQEIKVFTLKKDAELAHGIKIENGEKFSHRTDEFGFPTPYVSYKSEQGDFKFSSLPALERCLAQLHGRYKRFMAGQDQFNIDSKFFLYPGQECH